MKKSGLIQVTGFFDLIEGATKYLHTIGYEKHPFRPRIYTTYFLQFVITVSSLFFVANILYHWITIAKSKCHITVSDIHLVGDYDHACSRYTFELIMYGGYVISNIGWWLLFMTLGTLIATLMYGADVANALTLYWLLRFRPLRRIEERHLETHSYKAADKHMDKNMGDGEEDNNSTNDTNISANNTNSYGNNVGGSVKFGSFYGEEMDEIITDNKTMSELQVLIKRDAYERYLFTQNYMQIAGDIWSLLLILILLICIGIFVYTYYLTLYTVTTLNQPVSLTLVSICCASVVLFGFIVNLVAYANAAVDKILDGFLYSSTEDYILIGKRDEWISFVRESPMFWKIFGLSVTQAWIGNFLAGSMSSVVGGFLIAASYKK